MRNKIAKAIFILILVITATGLWAQPGGGGGGQGGGGPPSAGAPIDGGAVVLLVAVALYGYRNTKQQD